MECRSTLRVNDSWEYKIDFLEAVPPPPPVLLLLMEGCGSIDRGAAVGTAKEGVVDVTPLSDVVGCLRGVDVTLDWLLPVVVVVLLPTGVCRDGVACCDVGGIGGFPAPDRAADPP